MTGLDRALIHASTASVGVTGLAYAAFKHLMVSDDPFTAISHPLQPWALKSHLVAAPLLVFALGMIFKDHVVTKYRNGSPKPAKGSGVLILAAFLPATVTGYALPLIASGNAREGIAWAHIGFGLALLALYAVHLMVVPARRETKEGVTGNVVVTGIQIGRRDGRAR